jgi:hypothetical protein
MESNRTLFELQVQLEEGISETHPAEHESLAKAFNRQIRRDVANLGRISRENGVKDIPPVIEVFPDFVDQVGSAMEMLHQLCLGVAKDLLGVFEDAKAGSYIVSLSREELSVPYARVKGLTS